jgi:hypothetical protein
VDLSIPGWLSSGGVVSSESLAQEVGRILPVMHHTTEIVLQGVMHKLQLNAKTGGKIFPISKCCGDG